MRQETGMLDGIRKATQAGIGRVVMAFLLGLLIVAFAFWGIGDMFRGFVSDKVASVGSPSITAQRVPGRIPEPASINISASYKSPLTNAQARA